MNRYSLLLFVLLAAAGQAHAQTKAQDLFVDGLSHDFGSAPRGHVLTHYFRIKNDTKQPVNISHVRVSCGVCSSAQALQTWLQPGQETAIRATMDTNRFRDTKLITIYVAFGQPREEVRLWMQANSREDVIFQPDNLAFGRVKFGTTAESKMTITFIGGGATEITELKSDRDRKSVV